jgi:hypothetical protein
MSSFQNQLREQIKKYVSIDNYLKEQNAKLSKYREKKKALEANILYTIKTYNLNDIEINLPDGKLNCVKKEPHTPLNVSFLKTALVNFYSEKTNNMVAATQNAEQLLDYILKQRETKADMCLKRIIAKRN